MNILLAILASYRDIDSRLEHPLKTPPDLLVNEVFSSVITFLRPVSPASVPVTFVPERSRLAIAGQPLNAVPDSSLMLVQETDSRLGQTMKSVPLPFTSTFGSSATESWDLASPLKSTFDINLTTESGSSKPISVILLHNENTALELTAPSCVTDAGIVTFPVALCRQE